MFIIRIFNIVFIVLLIGFNNADALLKFQLNDGNNIPALAYGTGRNPDGKADPSTFRQRVFWAIEAGFRHIDTASLYKNEEYVGQALADAVKEGIVKREEVFVTAKKWIDSNERDEVVPALRGSLKRLGLDYVDLFLVHFPFSAKPDGTPSNVDYLDTWKGMEDAKELGLVKSIGVSNFNQTQLDRLWQNSVVKPAVIQTEVNPTNAEEALVSYCKDKGIVVMSFVSLGSLVQREGAEDRSDLLSRDNPELVAIAKKYGKDVYQVVLRYLIDRGIVATTSSSKKEHIKTSGDIFDFKLTEEEMETMRKFNKNYRMADFGSFKHFPNFPYPESY